MFALSFPNPAFRFALHGQSFFCLARCIVSLSTLHYVHAFGVGLTFCAHGRSNNRGFELCIITLFLFALLFFSCFCCISSWSINSHDISGSPSAVFLIFLYFRILYPFVLFFFTFTHIWFNFGLGC